MTTFSVYNEFARNAQQGDVYVSDIFGTRYVCLVPVPGAPLVLSEHGIRRVFDWAIRGLRRRLRRSAA